MITELEFCFQSGPILVAQAGATLDSEEVTTPINTIVAVEFQILGKAAARENQADRKEEGTQHKEVLDAVRYNGKRLNKDSGERTPFPAVAK